MNNQFIISSVLDAQVKYRLKGQPVSIVTTNIPSFMGSRLNLWQSSASRIGVRNPYNRDYNVSQNEIGFKP